MKLLENQLIDAATGEIKKVNDVVTDFRGDSAMLMGFEAPNTAYSNGRLYVSINGLTWSCNPSAYGLEIIQVTKDI